MSDSVKMGMDAQKAGAAMVVVRGAIRAARARASELLDDSRAKSMVLTKLDEAELWATKALCNV
jgi:hypothetical protein